MQNLTFSEIRNLDPGTRVDVCYGKDEMVSDCTVNVDPWDYRPYVRIIRCVRKSRAIFHYNVVYNMEPIEYEEKRIFLDECVWVRLYNDRSISYKL